MTFLLPRNLHTRIIFIVALLQLAAVGLFSLYALGREAGDELAERQALGQRMIDIAAPAVTRLIQLDVRGIQPYLATLLADRSVAAVRVTDSRGNAIFGEAKEQGRLHPLARWFDGGRPAPRLSAELRSDGVSWGTLSLDLSNAALNQTVHQRLDNAAYLVLLLLALDLIAIPLLVRSAIAPLGPLAAMAKDVSQGNWNRTVLDLTPNASDEVKQLSDAFIESAKTMRRQIRELEEARSQLTANELKLRKLVDGMQESLLEMDPSCRITFLNPAWATLTGYAAEAALNRPFAEFLVQAKQRVFFEPGKLEHLQLSNLKLELRAENGKSVWVRMSTSLQRNGQGAITGLVGTLEDITETLRLQELQHQHEQDLYRLTITDPLTGVYNRRHFDKLIENLLHINLHKGLPLALIVVDIDGFKFINDTYGHPVGDEVLRSVAAILRVKEERRAAVSRIAGDEFALLLQDLGEEEAGQLGRLIHEDLSRMVIPLQVGQLSIRTSIGIAVAPQHGKTPLELVRAADVALYHAKRSGRNRVDTLSKEHGAAIMDIFSQGFELRNAIAADMILPFIQPIVDLRSRRVMAYEVLTRMRRGDDFVPADDFIPIAEDLGLIREMDLFVITRALTLIPKSVHLFLNVSLNSFYAPEFAPQLKALLHSPLAKDRSITLEFTERQTTEMSPEFIRVFDDIRAGGCNVALDDFGVGYSTYSYLRGLRPEFVKIDGSFVLQIKENQEDMKIVQQIRELAHVVGASTIAEHIEDEETIAILVDLGVDYGQGYYFSKPLNVLDQPWLAADLV